MKKNTSEKILDEALNLFSKYGYAGTSVQDLGAAVGVKAPSLYKHFESKKAIYDEVVRRAKLVYKETLEEILKDGPDQIKAEKDATGEIMDYLVIMEKHRFHLFIANTAFAKVRRFHRLEIYQSRKNAKSFTDNYYFSAIDFYIDLFKVAFDLEGQDEKAKWLAQQYCGMVSSGLALCDALPGQENYVKELLEKLLRSFGEDLGIK